jgi:hypothetical protein
MRNLFIILSFFLLFACDKYKEDPQPNPDPENTKGKLELNVSVADITPTNGRVQAPTDIYLKIVQSISDNTHQSYFTDDAIVNSKYTIDPNPLIELEQGQYDILLVSSGEWTGNLVNKINAASYIDDPFKTWKFHKTTNTVIVPDIITEVEIVLEPQHTLLEFFLEKDVTMPEEVDKVEFIIKGWFLDFNPGAQTFTDKHWSTSDIKQYTEDNSTFLTLVRDDTSGEMILPPFSLYKNGEEDLGGITIRLYNKQNKSIWQDGIYTNLNIDWGKKYNVYYNPKIKPKDGAIRMTSISWYDLEEVDVYINSETE